MRCPDHPLGRRRTRDWRGKPGHGDQPCRLPRRMPADIDLDQARKVDASDGGFVWIGLHEPDQPLLRTVQQRFGLHDLAIEDALRAHQRPKLELYGDTLFIVVRTASLRDQQDSVRRDSYLRRARLRSHRAARFDHGLQGGAHALRGRAENADVGEGLVVFRSSISSSTTVSRSCRNSRVGGFARGHRLSPHVRRPNVERIYEVRRGLLLLGARSSRCRRLRSDDAVRVPLIDPTMHPYFRDIQDHVNSSR